MDSVSLSIIVPLFNEERVINEFYKRTKKVLHSLNKSHEIFFINDGSIDGTLRMLKQISRSDNNIKVLSFSRNFGHQLAITAGLDYAKGENIVIIDGDLQDPPELIPEMLKKLKEGYDIVYAQRRNRLGETLFKIFTANLFYRFLRKMANINIPVDVGDFRAMNRKALEALKRMREHNRFFRGLVSWIGFKQASIQYVRDKRYAGKSKYSFLKMFKLSLDGIVSFSFYPLRFMAYLGFFVSSCAFLYILYILYSKLILHKPIVGWASLMIIVLFLGGIQLIAIGVLGEYIGRAYDEIKRRPLYLVDDTVNIDQKYAP